MKLRMSPSACTSPISPETSLSAVCQIYQRRRLCDGLWSKWRRGLSKGVLHQFPITHLRSSAIIIKFEPVGVAPRIWEFQEEVRLLPSSGAAGRLKTYRTTF